MKKKEVIQPAKGSLVYIKRKLAINSQQGK
jgi:hypothetical protein